MVRLISRATSAERGNDHMSGHCSRHETSAEDEDEDACEFLLARSKIGGPTRASHILGKGMSAIWPLQTSLNDVIGLWSDSWKAVSRSICSVVTAPYRPYQYWMFVPVALTSMVSMGAVCLGRGSDAVRVSAVLMYRPVWVSRCHWRHGLRALFHHRSELGGQCLIIEPVAVYCRA
jgi:hypothetical protein